MSRGTFILSLDCEGLWGMADRPQVYEGTITAERLRWAYRTVLEILDRHDIPATFALVGLFSSDREVFEELRPQLQESTPHRAWLAPALAAIDDGSSDGWFLPETVEWIQAAGRHEIASHGLTHLPFDGKAVTSIEQRFELQGMKTWSDRHDVALETLVFPRNGIAGEQLLPDYGILAFRDGHRGHPGASGRIANLARELNIRQRSEQRPADSVPIRIPAGFFLNWRHGARRIVPCSITRRRFRSILGDASTSGRVAHLWLHPHNLITGSHQVSLLDQALGDVRGFADRGMLELKTQAHYARDEARRQTGHGEGPSDVV
jgi:hypothetical protein